MTTDFQNLMRALIGDYTPSRESSVRPLPPTATVFSPPMHTENDPRRSPSIPMPGRKPTSLADIIFDNKPIPHSRVDEYALHGDEAIKAVEKLYGPLDKIGRRVVELEGFVPVKYLDKKGVPTIGVGQTGEFMEKGFPESLKHHINRVKERVSNFDELPEDVQAELVQAEYRGDLGLSPKTIKLLNKGRFKEAAKEFLDHKEYKKYKKEGGGGNIPTRLEAVAQAIASISK